MQFLSSTTLALIAAYLFESVNGLVVPDTSLEKRSSGYFSLPFTVQKHAAGNYTTTASRRKRGDTSVTLQDNYVQYVTDIYLGSNAQHLTVAIDTGSSDLWVSLNDVYCELEDASCTANGDFDPSTSTTFKKLNQEFEILYVDGSGAQGYYGTDKFTFTSSGTPTVTDFQFAVATTASNQIGILGIALTNEEADVTQLYPNLPLTLTSEGFISKPAYSLYLNSEDATDGTLLFGGIDYAKITPPFVNLPMQDSNLELQVNTLDFDGESYTLNTAYLMDSGTSFTYLQNDVTQAIYDKLNAVEGTDENWGTYYAIEKDIVQDDWSFTYNLNGVSIDVPFKDLINAEFQPSSTQYALTVYKADNYPILGDNFLRHAYLYYDLSNSTISIGQVKYTDDTDIVAV